MTLAQQRVLFTTLIAKLIAWANDNGYAVALDQVKRTQAEADANAKSGKGISNSLHLSGLAADLLLYTYENGQLQYKTATPDYKPLGEYWKTLHPLACWGGDFKRADGNHFSLTRDGVR